MQVVLNRVFPCVAVLPAENDKTAVASGKGIVRNRHHTVGNFNLLQAGAVCKRFLPDRCHIVAKFECSIGVISRVNGDKLRVSITCRDCDVKYIENILRMYDMIGE